MIKGMMNKRFLLPLLLLCFSLSQSGMAESVSSPKTNAGAGADRVYGLNYEADFLPGEGVVQMSVTVLQSRSLLRRLSFNYDPARYTGFSGDGEITGKDGVLTWEPPDSGGTLNFRVSINHVRGKAGRYDSLMRDDWAIFRGDDLFPAARVKALKGAASHARLRMSGPPGWSFISAYPRSASEPDWFQVDWLDRKFDRPVGWMAAGKLGVRWGDVAGIRLAIAGPMGQGIRYLDIMAFLRWNLPALVQVFPAFPKRILLVSAGDPMWRGGLSGPSSLYIHAERPLISGNGTSTLLHELIHLAQGYRAEPGSDWIVESIAEFYTLEIMRRSGTLSSRRYEKGLDQLGSWANETDVLEAEKSSGSRTAKGVTVMQDLDTELREVTAGRYSLDDVAEQLSRDGVPVSTEQLRRVSQSLAGRPLRSLSPKRLAEE